MIRFSLDDGAWNTRIAIDFKVPKEITAREELSMPLPRLRCPDAGSLGLGLSRGTNQTQ
jgi:hypothetical protein